MSASKVHESDCEQGYRNCLRTIVSEAFGVRLKKGESKFDYRNGGNKAWNQRIDEIRLDRLTPPTSQTGY